MVMFITLRSVRSVQHPILCFIDGKTTVTFHSGFKQAYSTANVLVIAKRRKRNEAVFAFFSKHVDLLERCHAAEAHSQAWAQPYMQSQEVLVGPRRSLLVLLWTRLGTIHFVPSIARSLSCCGTSQPTGSRCSSKDASLWSSSRSTSPLRAAPSPTAMWEMRAQRVRLARAFLWLLLNWPCGWCSWWSMTAAVAIP